MKLKTIAIAIMLASFTFASCNKIKDALDVSFDANFTTSFPVDVQEESRDINAGGSFSVESDIDFTTNDELNKYKEKVKEGNITSIKLKVTSLSVETVDITNLSLFLEPDCVPFSVNQYLGDFQIQNGSTEEIELSDYILITDMIKACDNMSLTLSGNTSESPVSFTYEVTISVEVVANPL